MTVYKHKTVDFKFCRPHPRASGVTECLKVVYPLIWHIKYQYCGPHPLPSVKTYCHKVVYNHTYWILQNTSQCILGGTASWSKVSRHTLHIKYSRVLMDIEWYDSPYGRWIFDHADKYFYSGHDLAQGNVVYASYTMYTYNMRTNTKEHIYDADHGVSLW